MKKYSILELSTRLCVFTLFFFFATIMTRFLTRQIFVEKLAWNNMFTKLVFFEDSFLEEANMKDDTDYDDETEIEIEWDKIYPFDGESGGVTYKRKSIGDRYIELIQQIKMNVGQYAENFLLGHMQMTKIGKAYNKFIGCCSMPVNGSGENIIILNNGYMTYEEPKVAREDIELLANNVIEFSDYLSDKGITFIYANAGSKVCQEDKQLPAGG